MAGGITATSFTGSGAGLTALNASNLTSGTLPSAALSGTYSGALTLSNGANSFTGSGAGLTGVNAAMLGALASSAFAQLAANNTLSGNNTFTGTVSVATPASGGTTTAFSVQATNVGTANTAVSGLADGAGGTGVLGEAENGSTAIGVWGISSSGVAGLFNGNVNISGTLSKSSGSFKIDDPIDPANKYLYHSFVESPDMKNIYDGVVLLDAQGEAVVQLPDWFETLNKDFRYQLTAIGAPAPNLYIAQEVHGNRFQIAGGKPGMKVSWMVTGTRQDAWANAHRIPVEEDKTPPERGYYLHPELFGQPAERSVEWAQHPEVMKGRAERQSIAPKQ